MKSRTPRWKRCGHGPGALSPADQTAVGEFRALLAALKNPLPWTGNEDVAVQIGPFIERGRPRPGDDHGPTALAVALVDPQDGGRPIGTGWLRCDRQLIIGAWHPDFWPLTHTANGLPLPDQPLPPAHYAVHITHGGRPLLMIGPYTQCHQADHDAAHLRRRAALATGSDPITITAAPFNFEAVDAYCDPHTTNVDQLLDTTLTQECDENAATLEARTLPWPGDANLDDARAAARGLSARLANQPRSRSEWNRIADLGAWLAEAARMAAGGQGPGARVPQNSAPADETLPGRDSR